MAKQAQKRVALFLRKKGYSYTQIKSRIHVSKSTLSSWLKDFPLSKERIQRLRGNNPRRIEKFINTMKLKRELEESVIFNQVKKKIGRFTKREKIIAGLFLYWGEGTKAARYTVALSNTDPDAVKFFVYWLHLLDVDTKKLKVVLHLYKDMDVEKEKKFWSLYLRISLGQFRKPYIKNTRFRDITYRSGFGHGTCNVLYLNKDLYLYVKSGLKLIRMHA